MYQWKWKIKKGYFFAVLLVFVKNRQTPAMNLIHITVHLRCHDHSEQCHAGIQSVSHLYIC